MAKAAPRSIWTGSITFGLVNIPIRLYSAVREQTIHFHMLHDQDHARLQRKMVCSADGKEVQAEHTVKGYEIAPDQYVVVQQHELEAIAPQKTRTIEIQDFVELAEIDPVYYDRTYYVLPQETGVRAYRLLVSAMEKAKKVGIARFVMRNTEYLCALRPVEGSLCLETMHFGDEVLPLQEVDPVGHKSAAKADEREVKMAQQLIDSLSTKFKPDKYHDEYRKAVEELVEKKAAGEQIVVPPEPKEAPTRVGNLMAALQASLDKARGESGGKSHPERAAARQPGRHPGRHSGRSTREHHEPATRRHRKSA